MDKQTWVVQDECISCGVCIDNLPAVFRYTGNISLLAPISLSIYSLG